MMNGQPDFRRAPAAAERVMVDKEERDHTRRALAAVLATAGRSVRVSRRMVERADDFRIHTRVEGPDLVLWTEKI